MQGSLWNASKTMPTYSMDEIRVCRHFLYQSERMKDYEEKSIMYGIGSDHAADNNGLGNCKTLVAQ